MNRSRSREVRGGHPEQSSSRSPLVAEDEISRDGRSHERSTGEMSDENKLLEKQLVASYKDKLVMSCLKKAMIVCTTQRGNKKEKGKEEEEGQARLTNTNKKK